MESKGGGGFEANGNSDSGTNGATNGSAKRKREDLSGVKSETPTKKVKSDEDEEDDDDDQDDDG